MTESAATSTSHRSGGIKETIEQILVAFILAFVFRAFVVEAFVIPTGSMATTLLGAHLRFNCQDCGYDFTVNYSARGEGDDLVIPRFAGRPNFPIHCPNCGFRVPADVGEKQPDAANPPVHYGDRILVLKYLYLLQEPRRWDVVVFKSPADPRYAQNYIKRLIGKPGESVMILDGDIYVREGSDGPFRVQSKPRWAQEALWRIIYDNDHYPNGVEGAAPKQPWTTVAGSGWSDAAAARQLIFNNPTGQGTLAFDPKANPATHAFTDFLAYDTDARWQQLPYNIVTDLKLDFYYERRGAEGELLLEMTKLGGRYTAQFDGQGVTLLRDGQVVVGPAALPAGTGPVHVELANVDYRLSLRLDGKEVLSFAYEPDLPRLLGASRRDERAPLPQVRITASRQECVLSHVRLFRDVYYTNRDTYSGRPQRQATPENPVVLGEDEYFVLGDNSLVSLDGRYWDRPIILPHEQLAVDAGRVPGRFLLGKAFFVYWPAGFRPLSENAPAALAPNFGQMRFIH